MTESDLDRMLAAVRAAPPVAPSDALMARVLADALAEQPRPRAPVAAGAVPRARPGFWAALSAGFGGSGVLAGLGGVAALGLALGYVQPTALFWLTDGLPGAADTSLELLPATDPFLTEG